ncbi:MAG: hypothetical protein K8F91_26215 [Candidatus Obscuribacterales bacterium]|nr:hypothetical protein [Candidatus Obscuribacterales bacterium]
MKFIPKKILSSALLAALLTSCANGDNLVERSRIGFHYGQGLAKIRDGHFLEAVRTLSVGISYQQNAGLYSARGFAYSKIGDYKKAIDDFNSSLSLSSGHSVDIAAANRHLSPIDYDKKSFIYAARGLTYGMTGDFEHGLADTDEAIRLDPKESAWYCFRAALNLERQDTDLALNDLNRAIAIEPKDPIAYHLRARALEIRGEREAAQKDRKTARKLDYPKVVDYTQFGLESMEEDK